jgi:CubicO group peptidase (beta-lactamase class C family)
MTGAPVDADTVFRVGSLTKSIVALGVMRLVDQGKLHLDRPLREIIPDAGIENPWEDTSPVTLAQCMEHTAGLDDVRFNEVFTDEERISVVETLRLNPRSRRIRWRPGTRHAYSNVGYTLAARAIEVASGEPFDVYLKREILAPMGITDVEFSRTEAIAARMATGHMAGATPVPYFAFAHRGAGGMLASPADLGKLVRYWTLRGKGYPPIVSAAGLDRIERSETLPYPHVVQEYGLANYTDVSHPVIAHGHDGGMPGFHSSFRYVPSEGVGYAMMLNGNYMFRGYFEIRALIFAYLTRGKQLTPPAVAREDAEPPGAEYFAYASPRIEAFAFIDRVRNGWDVDDLGSRVRLTEKRGFSHDLLPDTDGGYREPGECGSSVRFTTGPDGKRAMVMSFLYAEEASGWWAHAVYTVLGFTMMLINLAPMLAAGFLLFSAIERKRLLPPSLVIWPAVAGLCCLAVPHLFDLSFFRGVIGQVHPLTVGLFAATVMFAVASAATLAVSVRWALRPDRPSWGLRLLPGLFGVASSAITVWAAMHGMVGLRTWAF